jgi:hypothetical protein
MAPTPPIGARNKITAEQFNDLVQQYDIIWADAGPYEFEALTELTVDEHSTGWGQNDVEPLVAKTQTILSEHTNRLSSQINAGLQHLKETNVFVPHYAPGTLIRAEYYHQINAIINQTNTERFELNPYHSDYLIEQGIVNSTPIWNTNESDRDIESGIKFHFESYSEARYFFNSGGALTLILEASGGSNTSDDWNGLFLGLDEIRITALDVKPIGYNQGISVGGFYECRKNQDPVAIFTATAFFTGGEYGEYGDVYGSYGSGMYSNRILRIFIQGVENPDGSFDVRVIIRLQEPNTSTGVVDTNLNVDAGCVYALEAPDIPLLNTSIGENFKAGAYTYQFVERNYPDILLDFDWRSV